MPTLKQRIKYYRTKKGLTIEEVAKALDIKSPNYVKYENGERTPKDDKIQKLAHLFQTDYNYLIDDAEKELLDLFYQKIILVALGNKSFIENYYPDMITNPAYIEIENFFEDWMEAIGNEDKENYKKYLETPSIANIIDLYKSYEQSINSPDFSELTNIYATHFLDITEYHYIKLLFCISVYIYLQDNLLNERFINDIRQYEGKDYDVQTAIKIFALNVFIPYAALITDTLDFIVSNEKSIGNFHNLFLFDCY